jgi:hippurate hydrolase
MHPDPVLPGIRAIEAEMVDLRHRIHAYPELGFEEFATSDLVAECIAAWAEPAW